MEKFLLPEDAITQNLADVKPIYSATFTFANEAGDLCFTKTWRETQDAGAKASTYEEISKKWTQLERGPREEKGGERQKDTAASLLDISLADLNTGQAWQFDIESTRPIQEHRLSKQHLDFGYSVKFDPKGVFAQDKGSNKPFAVFKSAAVNLIHLRQRTSYRYHIRTEEGMVTDYTLDVTRFQDRTYPLGKSTYVAAQEPTVYEPRWSLSVYRTEWDTKFAQNESLKIGEMADWEDGVDAWFPEDPTKDSEAESKGAGVEHLMEKLKRIAKMVREMDMTEQWDGELLG